MAGRRRPLRGSESLARRPRPRVEREIRPEDWATKDKPIGMCRGCLHHTSAFCGSCTAFVMVGDVFGYCGHDCRESLEEGSE